MRLDVGKDMDQDFCRKINGETTFFKRHVWFWCLSLRFITLGGTSALCLEDVKAEILRGISCNTFRTNSHVTSYAYQKLALLRIYNPEFVSDK